jgi:hypothetical protein
MLFLVSLALLPVAFAQLDDVVDRKARVILKRTCVVCHSGAKPADDLELNDAHRLANALSTEKKREDIVEAILDKPMPPDEDGWKRSFERNYDVSEERLKDLQLSDAEVETLTTWIKGYRPDEGPNRPHLSHPKLVEAILADVKSHPAPHRKYLRYLSLSNLYNAGDSDENLEIYRKGIRKLLNSLTWHPEIQKFSIVNNTQLTLLRFDLREMEYPQGKEIKKWDAALWEEIANDYPYFIPVRTPAATELKEISGTAHYFLRADWFAFALSRPPLYHQILGLPESIDQLEKTLGVNVVNNIEWTLSPEGVSSPRAIRAGTTISGVSRNHRIIERHPLLRWSGAYWLSYDFRASEAKGSSRDIRERPLGPKGKNAFQHDGGEVIFNLPNGMQAYYLATSEGERLDVAPTDIVQNHLRADGKVINGVSCIACHAAGMNPIKAEVRQYVLKTSNDREKVRQVKQLYPGQKTVDELLERDRRKFTKASADADALHPGVEPVSKLVDRFEGRVTLAIAAAELDKPIAELKQILKSPTFRELETQLLANGISRNDFIQDFKNLRKKLFGEFPSPRASLPLAPKSFPEKQPTEPDTMDYITLGSHKDDVIRVQGTPDKINRLYESLGYHEWHYGRSHVQISVKNSKVLSWSNSGKDLKVQLLPGENVTNLSHITQGSHQDDVVRVQGTPDKINRLYESLGYHEWHYGRSHVQISVKDSKVLSWSNSVKDLKVQLLPGENVTNLPHIMLGSHEDDVIRVQGTPDKINRLYESLGYHEWHYGRSHVQISVKDWTVLGWDNSGKNLKIK